MNLCETMAPSTVLYRIKATTKELIILFGMFLAAKLKQSSTMTSSLPIFDIKYLPWISYIMYFPHEINVSTYSEIDDIRAVSHRRLRRGAKYSWKHGGRTCSGRSLSRGI